MSEAGLSEEEKEIIRGGDEQEILRAIGWPFVSAGPLQIVLHVTRPRRKIPPPPS